VYVLELRNGTLYVGFSSNVAGRVQQHREGRGAKITARHGVSQVLWVQPCTSVPQAKRLETSWVLQYREAGEVAYGGGYLKEL